MSKRPPYLEIAVTILVMTFLGLVIIGSFNQRSDDAARVTMRSD